MEEKLLEIVKRVLKVENVSLDTHRDETMEWDSLAHIRIVAEVEEEFKISIPIDEIVNIETVRDFLKYIKC